MQVRGATLVRIKLFSFISILIFTMLYAATAASGQTFTTLHSFDLADGASPDGTLVQGTDGNLYGTTSSHGSNGQGTFFKITPDGTFTTIYNFCSLGACADGAVPKSGVIQGTDGNFYGTTFAGGTTNSGTVFKITPQGVLTTLYSFCQQSMCYDGGQPAAALVQASDGNLYGTTTIGGGNFHGGTIFRITPSGSFTAIVNDNVYYPLSGPLIQATDGNLYGASSGGSAGGRVFKVSLSGLVTVVYSFNGDQPLAGVIQGTDGNFYGTTNQGLPGENAVGEVFELTPAGILTTIHSFCSPLALNCLDGASPVGGVIQGTDGSFYGTTTSEGANQGGTIFQIDSTGTLTTLYSFCSQSGCTDGQAPITSLTLHTNGSLYGTTSGGGASSAGTVFRQSPDFSVSTTSGSPTSQTVTAGQNATFSLAFAPILLFTGTVNLSCAITPAATPSPTCALSSGSVQISGTGPQTITVKVETTAPITAGTAAPHFTFPKGPMPLAWPLLLFPGSMWLWARNRKRIPVLAVPTVVLAFVFSVGCGGSGSSLHTSQGTPAGTYTATVTATSGSTSHNMALQVVVQ